MIIDFDTETTGLQPFWHSLFLVQFYDGEEAVCFRHPEQREEIQQWLSRDAYFRATNAKFDLHFLEQAGYELPPLSKIIDAQALFHLVDSTTSTALKERERYHFGAKAAPYEAQVKEWLKEEHARRREDARAVKKATGEKVAVITPTYKDVPMEIMEPYALHDVLIQRKLCELYGNILAREKELYPLYTLERDLTEAIYVMERRGIPVDRTAVEALYESLSPSVAEREAYCMQLAHDPEFNPGSPKQVLDKLLERGISSEALTVNKKNTSTQKYEDKLSSGEDVLQRLDDDLAAAILDFRGEKKIQGAFVGPLLGYFGTKKRGIDSPFIAPDGRIHPSFKQVGPVTGRMACKDPNVQQWPQRDDLRLRYVLKAGEGKKLVVSDLDSIELRLFAYFAGEGDILNEIRKPNSDLHTMTAEAAGLPSRQDGKTLNYAMIYLGTEYTIARTFNVSLERGKEIYEAFHARYPEARAFSDRVLDQAEELGYVTTAWGRRIHVAEGKSIKKQLRNLVSGVIQGTAADIIKVAVVNLHKRGVPLVSVVHDEVIAEVDANEAESVARIVEEEMTNHPRITKIMPLGAEADIVDRWSQAKDKSYIPDYARNLGVVLSGQSTTVAL